MTRTRSQRRGPAARRARRQPAAPGGWRARLRPAALYESFATATVSSVASVSALGVVILGAAPMAAAQANTGASTILAQSLSGSVAPMDYPAKDFQLTDQNGRTVTLATLRGKVVLLTFLDPVCTSDCPLIAQEFRAAGQLLGASSSQVELVAIVANPVFYQRVYTEAFTRQEGLTQVPNWQFLTGLLAALRQVWADYGIDAEVEPGGSMVGHTEVAYVIDPVRACPRGILGRPGTRHDSDPGLVRVHAGPRRPAVPGGVMKRPGLLGAVILAVTALAACGTQQTQVTATAAAAPPPSLALSLDSAAGTWATVQMGGSAAQYNNFWQLFVRPAGAAGWRLVTPPGMADNGGLLLASNGGRSLVTGFRPSQLITFSPLTSTSDDGAHWATGTAADGGLSDVPDALAAAPGSGDLIALVPGAVELSRSGGSGWTTVARAGSVTGSAAGRACGLSGLTAVAFSPAGIPMVAGACTKAGAAGIFAFESGRWRAAGPALPASLAGQPVTVLRLTTAGGPPDGAAVGRRRVGGHRRGRLDRERRRALATVPGTANPGKAGAIRVVRSRRRGGTGAVRRTRGGPGRPGEHLAAASRAAFWQPGAGHRRWRPGRGARLARIGPDRLGGRARVLGMGQGTGHQRADPVRFLHLT